MTNPTRFAILDHDWPTPHRDLLLEDAGVLKAWRLPPDFDGQSGCEAEVLPDHRLIYLEYEGPVSGARGSVSCWDRGICVWIQRSAERCTARLHGQVIQGRIILAHVAGGHWELRFAREDDLL